MNIEKLARELELPVSTFIELSELFFSTSTASLDRLKSGLENNSTTDIATAAHEIKGAALNLGFSTVATLAALIEENASSGSATISAWEQDLISALGDIKRNIDAIEREG